MLPDLKSKERQLLKQDLRRRMEIVASAGERIRQSVATARIGIVSSDQEMVVHALNRIQALAEDMENRTRCKEEA